MERNEKVANSIKEIAATFLGRENNKTSLLTVTGASVSPDLKRATIFITVFPSSNENEVLHFTQRRLGELRDNLKNSLPIKTIPFLEVKIDEGEKNRQKIDELLRESK